jgi:hypothetical protein
LATVTVIPRLDHVMGVMVSRSCRPRRAIDSIFDSLPPPTPARVLDGLAAPSSDRVLLQQKDWGQGSDARECSWAWRRSMEEVGQGRPQAQRQSRCSLGGVMMRFPESLSVAAPAQHYRYRVLPPCLGRQEWLNGCRCSAPLPRVWKNSEE